MAGNYLQYIQSTGQNIVLQPLNYLVSGVDIRVSNTIMRNVISSAYDRGTVLFILDNTQRRGININFDRYHIVNILTGEVNLCDGLLDVSSLLGISNLRALLEDLGFDSIKSMKVVSYLKFVQETERRLGHSAELSVDTIEEYGGVMLVEWKLKQLVASGTLDAENFEYLMGKYLEVSGAVADFEAFLVLLAPFMGNTQPVSNTAVYIPVGEFASDKPMQTLLCQLLKVYIKQNPLKSTILILDDGNGDRSFLVKLLSSSPVNTETLMLSKDVFTFSETELSVLMNTFPVRIYTRHTNMSSCEKIENLCGQIDVVKHSFSVTVDRRHRANSAWDILMGTNRAETSIANAPVKEYRFKKEIINSLYEGTGIIDYAGNKVLFSF